MSVKFLWMRTNERTGEPSESKRQLAADVAAQLSISLRGSPSHSATHGGGT